MARKRKALSKKTRFEVFKRDSFACQYCGQGAPDVLLHVDHIVPVADGGGDEITNLVTACVGCNIGKGATPLADGTVAARQRKQLQDLQERRELIEMMAQWRRELDGIREQEATEAAAYFGELSGWALNDLGLRSIRDCVRKFGFSETLDGISTACSQYLDADAEGKNTRESVEVALKKIGGICYVRAQSAKTPWLSDFYKMRAAGRTSFAYWKDWVGCPLLREAFELGVPPRTIRNVMNESSSWTRWQESMESLLDEVRQ
jgi:hypothetical protein